MVSRYDGHAAWIVPGHEAEPDPWRVAVSVELREPVRAPPQPAHLIDTPVIEPAADTAAAAAASIQVGGSARANKLHPWMRSRPPRHKPSGDGAGGTAVRWSSAIEKAPSR